MISLLPHSFHYKEIMMLMIWKDLNLMFGWEQCQGHMRREIA